MIPPFSTTTDIVSTFLFRPFFEDTKYAPAKRKFEEETS
jgi:hypothetical protein